ncbi:hypothetical protein A5698_09950 [Mycobacterium sp. E136]|uniref:hypothetical protein n=1 Tax=Mycobacterium sp. E136 TaxID=1834125 RepID=UPI0007FCA9DD|nr:hypothetical protein [Mycobacterium sp. E136]OBG99425.1 hypothetical protein A5698_09950 [Mycobacterium sp. E136]
MPDESIDHVGRVERQRALKPTFERRRIHRTMQKLHAARATGMHKAPAVRSAGLSMVSLPMVTVWVVFFVSFMVRTFLVVRLPSGANRSIKIRARWEIGLSAYQGMYRGNPRVHRSAEHGDDVMRPADLRKRRADAQGESRISRSDCQPSAETLSVITRRPNVSHQPQ